MRTVKVGRLTLGLVLIIIGVAMAAEIYTDLDVLDPVLRSWPVAIILLGLEYITAAKNPETKVRLSAGSLALIAVVLIIATGYRYSNRWFWLDNWTPFSGLSEPYRVTVTIDEPFGTGLRRLEVQAVDDVIIRGGDQDSVAGTVTLLVRARSLAEAERMAERIKVDTTRIGDTMVISAPKPANIPDRISIALSADLGVPSHVSVKVNTISGSTDISNVYGDVTVNSVSGSVHVDASPRSVRVDSISGGIDAGLNPEMTSMYLKTVSGSIEVFVHEGTGGSVSVNTVSGPIHTGATGIVVEKGPGRNEARGTFGTGATNISIHSVSGSVTFR